MSSVAVHLSNGTIAGVHNAECVKDEDEGKVVCIKDDNGKTLATFYDVLGWVIEKDVQIPVKHG